MKFQLERLGGFIGMTLKVRVDADQLDPEERLSLQTMVETARFFSLPPKILPGIPNPDRFLYRITVEKLEISHTVEVGEANMPESLQPLVQRLTILGRKAPK
jgi:hypothetical protein